LVANKLANWSQTSERLSRKQLERNFERGRKPSRVHLVANKLATWLQTNKQATWSETSAETISSGTRGHCNLWTQSGFYQQFFELQRLWISNSDFCGLRRFISCNREEEPHAVIEAGQDF